MPTPTYDLIASNVLSSSASSVTFSSIPATYRDLVVIAQWTGLSSTVEARVRFNSDTGTNYSQVRARGNGTSAFSDSTSGDTYALSIDATTSSAAIKTIQIMDYSVTDKHKTFLIRDNRASEQTIMLAGRWASTSAINAITLLTDTNQFASGSTFYLYGIVS